VFVKAVFILFLSYTLTNFHKSSSSFLQEIYFLVPCLSHALNIIRMNMELDSNFEHPGILMELDFILSPQPDLNLI